MSNLQLYNIELLKKEGINFKLTYTIEFTQNQLHYDEMIKKGIYDNIKKKEFDNIEESVNFLIKLYDDQRKIPVLYYQLFLSLKINDNTVMEDTIVNLNYTDSTCNLLKNLRENNKMLSNEVEVHREYLNQFMDGLNCFKRWKDEKYKNK